ncbi:aspartate carbamoyltransferase catalytic subunit [Halalkalibacter sp. APA_J-10(15)]|uniref:aspartate carbamoyltransferase catalytic subunit n=1 Tax=unclassified Halalkalibacter TaxID=2893063 RepID=UPI001FF62005|nr:aspartate carbamoyltransferase catalytic subunit [Halalkalibacter sp. APA_J-10(15)]MCK0470688.1 aspartate carbamoyltransferase catalytic subunit [Halalkalibacter sp. APA_J-10(15)]
MMTAMELQQRGDLLTLDNMTTMEIIQLLGEAEQFATGYEWTTNQQAVVANLFFEPSTRTRYSFEVAQKLLGFHVLSFSEESSSVQKGESLLDTVKTFESIGANVLVIRHPENEYYEQIKDQLSIPIVNGGDGSGHHPTQSLLDMLTIQQEFGTFAGLNIVITGDLRHSRVARSNAATLTRLGANVKVAGPIDWMEGYTHLYEHVDFDTYLPQADVVMLLRIQHERHDQSMSYTKEEYHRQYGLSLARESQLKQNAIILHPGPVNRGVELADELVEGKHSRIFKQMKNGVAVRKAVMKRAILKQSL